MRGWGWGWGGCVSWVKSRNVDMVSLTLSVSESGVVGS